VPLLGISYSCHRLTAASSLLVILTTISVVCDQIKSRSQMFASPTFVHQCPDYADPTTLFFGFSSPYHGLTHSACSVTAAKEACRALFGPKLQAVTLCTENVCTLLKKDYQTAHFIVFHG
jgi:hypothetical protein